MIYRSNLTAPDLTAQFPHLHSRVMGHSFGHDVLSDWSDKPEGHPLAFYKNCGLWTHDEVAILYNVVKLRLGVWLDIGSHTGWTSAHILAAGASGVWGVDPMYRVEEFRERAQNQARLVPCPYTAMEFFDQRPVQREFAGVVIDGDHEPGEPMRDAVRSALRLEYGGVILFHDFGGLPVRAAVKHLMDSDGFMCRVYLTPHVVAVCWRGQSADDPGEFHPPIHVPDQFIVRQNLPARWPENDWSKYI